MKIKFAVLLVMITLFANLAFGGSLPLNTGYDYSNYNIYPNGTNDDYWIRIASFPTMAVGPSWAVSSGTSVWAPPLIGAGGIPSTWVNAFGSTNASPTGASAQNPAYAIYRKCFCITQSFQKANVTGSVRSDEAVQIWLNSVMNEVMPSSPINLNNPPYQFNYDKQSAFRVGKNCLYVLIEDTGGHTGFNLAGSINVSGPAPLIAKGPNMSFQPCSCGTGLPTKAVEIEEQKVLSEIIKAAEGKRIERGRQLNPRN